MTYADILLKFTRLQWLDYEIPVLLFHVTFTGSFRFYRLHGVKVFIIPPSMSSMLISLLHQIPNCFGACTKNANYRKFAIRPGKYSADSFAKRSVMKTNHFLFVKQIRHVVLLQEGELTGCCDVGICERHVPSRCWPCFCDSCRRS